VNAKRRQRNIFLHEDAFRLNVNVTQYVLVATCEKTSTGVSIAASMRKFLAT